VQGCGEGHQEVVGWGDSVTRAFLVRTAADDEALCWEACGRGGK
jgi:hypothetical protein